MRVFLAFFFLLVNAPVQTAAQDVPVEPAEESGQLDDAARVLFDRGTEAYDAGRFAEALSQYSTAFELSARPTLLYNIAVCHDRLEHKAEAVAFYGRFVEALPDSPRVEVARSRAAILEEALAASEVEADGDARVVVSPPDSPSLAGPVIAFSVAGAGLVIFAVAAALAAGAFSDAEVLCQSASGCDFNQLDSVDQLTLVADIGLGVAILGAVIGSIWVLAAGNDETIQVSPHATVHGAGLGVQGSF